MTYPPRLSCQVLNVSFAFELMQDGGLEKPKPRPEGTFFLSLSFPGSGTVGWDLHLWGLGDKYSNLPVYGQLVLKPTKDTQAPYVR